eukprot:c15198_g1_i2.p1 GENE.c15198_g1_i2~~c15198_g1_i2.p1  ORF type:complete len:186 (+),score=46.46 c15198_g1_i2:45-560(+)
MTAVCIEILDKGQLQVAEKERQHQSENLLKDIATVVADKCVNPETQRPYAVTTIEQAMKDAHFSVVPSRSAKQQALDVIRLLQQSIPIERAKMRLFVQVGVSLAQAIKDKLARPADSFENEDYGIMYSFEINIDPGEYRFVEDAVREVSKGQGVVDVLELAVHEEGDAALE